MVAEVASVDLFAEQPEQELARSFLISAPSKSYQVETHTFTHVQYE